MSIWHEIKKQEDVQLSYDCNDEKIMKVANGLIAGCKKMIEAKQKTLEAKQKQKEKSIKT